MGSQPLTGEDDYNALAATTLAPDSDTPVYQQPCDGAIPRHRSLVPGQKRNAVVKVASGQCTHDPGPQGRAAAVRAG